MGSVARNLVLVLLAFSVPYFFSAALIPDEIEFEMLVSENDTSGASLTEPAKDIFAMKAGGFFSLEKDMVEAYGKRSAVLSGIARSIWKKNPWYGVGVGAFALHAPFLLTREESRLFQDRKHDWRTKILACQLREGGRKNGGWNDIRPRNRDPHCAFNSYWTFLSERGLLGTVLAAIVLGLLLVSFFRRLVSAVVFLRHQDDADIVAFACPPITWIAPFAISLLLSAALFAPILGVPPMWLTIVAPLAVAAASFPKKPDTSKVLQIEG